MLGLVSGQTATATTHRNATRMHAFRYILNQLIRTPSREWPWLPNELVHYIFDLAAASSLESCKSLTLVSSWARMIALPYLNPVIILEEPTEKNPFPFPFEVFDSGRRIASPYAFTRYLFCDAEADAWFHREKGVSRRLHPIAAQILSNCIQLQSIYIGIQLLANTLKLCAVTLHDHALPRSLQDLELTIGMDDDPEQYDLSPVAGNFPQAFYQRVTHLRLQFVSEVHHFEILSYYLNVTHFAFHVTVFQRVGIECFERAMEHVWRLPQLQVVVLMASSRCEWDWPFLPFPSLLELVRAYRKKDSRVFGAVTAFNDLEVFKEECIHDSVWKRALDFSLSVGLIESNSS